MDERYAISRYEQAVLLLPPKWQRLARQLPDHQKVLAEELRLNRADPAAARDSLLQTMACKSAIKAGMWSDPSELQALADKVQSGEIRYCPHGRPVAVKLSKYEMEKMFKRA